MKFADQRNKENAWMKSHQTRTSGIMKSHAMGYNSDEKF